MFGLLGGLAATLLLLKRDDLRVVVPAPASVADPT